MNQRFTLSSKLAAGLVVSVLVLVPFHAFLTISASSLVGHYTLLRLWDNILLIILVGIVLWWLIKDAKLRSWFMSSLLVRLVGAYVGLTILLGLVAWLKDAVILKALGYGILVNLRFVLWFLVVMLVAQQSAWLRIHWPKLVLIPAAIVIGFAILQYTVLPHNFLAQFGYGPTTIDAIETINDNPEYIRVQSTLRGANPLGAYLVVVFSTLGALYLAGRKRIICIVLGFAAALALFASGSRSAWGATAVSLLVLIWLGLKSRRNRVVLGLVSTAFMVGAVGAFLIFRDNPHVQNAVLHTEESSVVEVTSNEAHASAFTEGLHDIAHQPLGDGPGTAGPASVYNPVLGTRIAENYYVQIAQEVGWLGLALLLGIMVLVMVELFHLRNNSLLALALFASFIGLAVVNLVSHAWVDDTLAFLWWGLAGVALGQPLVRGKSNAKTE